MNISDYLDEEHEAFQFTDLTEADVDRIFKEVVENDKTDINK